MFFVGKKAMENFSLGVRNLSSVELLEIDGQEELYDSVSTIVDFEDINIDYLLGEPVEWNFDNRLDTLKPLPWNYPHRLSAVPQIKWNFLKRLTDGTVRWTFQQRCPQTSTIRWNFDNRLATHGIVNWAFVRQSADKSTINWLFKKQTPE